MHLEPYNGHVFPSTQSYLASSSTPTSCFQLFGGDGGGAAPPSPSASVDHMVSSPAANVLTPSATATDAVARCGGGGIIFQFPPPQPPMLAAGKDSGWEAMSSSSQHQQQHSPMAISPSFSTLNTPRGSITSTRSQHSSHSPMGMIVDSASMVPGQHSAEQAYHLGKTPTLFNTFLPFLRYSVSLCWVEGELRDYPHRSSSHSVKGAPVMSCSLLRSASAHLPRRTGDRRICGRDSSLGGFHLPRSQHHLPFAAALRLQLSRTAAAAAAASLLQWRRQQWLL